MKLSRFTFNIEESNIIKAILRINFLTFFYFNMKIEDEEDGNLTVSSRTASFLLPSALPLKRNSKKPMRRYEEWDDKGKDTKISKIFQLAITALSFLAFGGYLLTLIIMAIRRTAATTTASSFIVLSV